MEIYYHAGYNEIWEKVDDHVIRGCQAILTYGDVSVPDHLGFIAFKYDKRKWKQHLKFGWLIKLEGDSNE